MIDVWFICVRMSICMNNGIYMWVWIIGYENIRESQIKIIFYLDWYANILYFGMIVFTVKALMV